ncbi:hypothetical protein BKA70DRAFT_1430142 [Coprinopsis sp. MPI-PUGE-AT-0042]|nr:hypothetical protein BKA70DRAFT_1430142 [Coprinopsis sp. MPI-PUGE-AT-0042]
MPPDIPAYPPVLDKLSWARLSAVIPPVTKAKPALTTALKKLKDQDAVFALLTELGAHVPDTATHRSSRSKLAIITSDKNPIKSNGKPSTKTFVRYCRLYQCQCGINNHEGHQPSKKRTIPYDNVGCPFWMLLVTTHICLVHSTGPGMDSEDDREDDGDDELEDGDVRDRQGNKYQLITIDEIYGDLHHSSSYEETVLPTRTIRQPMHPALREKALHLLRDGTPIALVRKACRNWARTRWGSHYGDGNYRFRVKNSDASALYRTLKGEAGIHQKSEAHTNGNLVWEPMCRGVRVRRPKRTESNTTR